MKVNLIYGEGDVLSGYLNLHPFAMQDTEDVKIADIKKLDRWIADAQATEIIATDVIDYLTLYEVPKVIAHWAKKLRHGGKIVIGGTDMNEVARGFVNGDINLETTNKLLHGQQTQPHLKKLVNLTGIGLAQFLTQDAGLKILKVRSAGYNYVVEAERP
jgi:hypothetical protein